MPRSLPLLFALALIAALAPGQTARPQPPQQSEPAPTIKTSAQLVIVDVVVTDSHLNPIHNLKSADFTVLENNAPQEIRNFEEHSAAPANPRLETMPALPPGVFTNYSPAPATSSLNILLLDTLNTPLQDQAYVRSQLRQYLKNAQPGNRIAIFGLTSRLTLLQGFTSDPEILRAAVNKKAMKSSPLLDDPVGGGGGPQPLSDAVSESGMGNDPAMASVIANLQQFEAEQTSFQLQLRARYTLDAMNLLARYLSGLPGRKNLIWFSGSFPINILPDGDLQNPFAAIASSADEFRETTNLLSRSQVAVYPIDARGLMVAPTLSASNSSRPPSPHNPGAFAKADIKFLEQTANEHGTMMQMAQQTGGHAFVNTNGLSQAVAKAVDAGSNFYTISYTPTNTKWNGDFRKIQVKLRQQGYTLSYRRGYFSDGANAPANHGSSLTPATASAPPDTMRIAMMRGAPDPTQIIFTTHVLPATDTTEDTPAENNTPNPSRAKPPYRRYLVDIAADPRAILINKTPEGAYRLSLQFATFVYDQDGVLINSVGTTVNANLTLDNYRRVLRSGIPYHQEISVPAKGEYFLRIGTHDLTSDRTGAIEIPIDSVKNLPPPNPPAATTPK